MIDLTNRTAVITGASQGIGKAVADRLAAQGANLVLLARDNERLDALKIQLSDKYPQCFISCYPVDLSDRETLSIRLKDILSKHKVIDILVNNAGVLLEAPVTTSADSMVDELFTVNVYAVISLTRVISRRMVNSNFASIINIASIVGERGAPGQSVYSATKGAIASYTKSLAKELGVLGIRVNAIAPGFVNTAMTKHYSDDRKKEIENSISLSKLGEPEDIAMAVAFLGSDASAYITGQVLGVDGGMVL